jgi:hypothetical protein
MLLDDNVLAHKRTPQWVSLEFLLMDSDAKATAQDIGPASDLLQVSSAAKRVLMSAEGKRTMQHC